MSKLRNFKQAYIRILLTLISLLSELWLVILLYIFNTVHVRLMYYYYVFLCIDVPLRMEIYGCKHVRNFMFMGNL